MESPIIFAQEYFDDLPFVDSAVVPDQDHVPSEVSQKQSQEFDDLHPRDVLGVKADAKPHALALGRDRDGRNSGNLIAAVAVAQQRGFADGRPGSTDAGDKQEAAFIEEGEMGPKFFGFFLYAATYSASNARWLPRFSPGRVSPAFGSSTAIAGASTSKPRLGYIQSQNAFGFVLRCALESRAPQNIRRPQILGPEHAATLPSAVETDAESVPDVVGHGVPPPSFFGRLVAIAPLNLRRLAIVEPRTEMIFRTSKERRLDVCDVPVVALCQGVSCPTV